MADQKNIHYRTGGKLTHCGCECLPGGNDIERIIIAKIEYKESETINGRTENGVWIAHFAQNPYTSLPLVLNATNRKRLVKLFPDCDGYIARLENVPVRLTREKTRDVQDGGETWGLRISKIPASAAPAEPASVQKKVITAESVGKVVAWAKSHGYDIDKVSDTYDYESDAVKNEIASALAPAAPEDPSSDDLPN